MMELSAHKQEQYKALQQELLKVQARLTQEKEQLRQLESDLLHSKDQEQVNDQEHLDNTITKPNPNGVVVTNKDLINSATKVKDKISATVNGDENSANQDPTAFNNKNYNPDESDRRSPPPPKEYVWDYKQQGDDWSGTCSTGKKQSPIDLVNAFAHKLMHSDDSSAKHHMEPHYRPLTSCEFNMSMVHTGHALELSGDFGYLYSGCCRRAKYVTKKISIHSPSEHTIDNTPFDMEVQVLHQRDDSSGNDNLLGVSYLFKLDQNLKANEFLNTLGWDQLPQEAKQERVLHGGVDLNMMFDSMLGDYFAYEGSLTGPPCDETVIWRVFVIPQPISQDQLQAISNIFRENRHFAVGNGNNRRTQDLNGRELFLITRHSAS